MKKIAIGIMTAVLLVGCATIKSHIAQIDLDKLIEFTGGDFGLPKIFEPSSERPADEFIDEIPMDKIKWHQAGFVAGWPKTHDLEVKVGRKLELLTEGTKVWRPAVKGVVGNAWFFIKLDDGFWHAGTFEWLRPGKQVLPKREVVRGKLKSLHSVLPRDWEVKVGETYGFMDSGLCRGPERNIEARNPIKLVEWI